MTAPDLFYRDNAHLRARAREGQSKVGKSGEVVAKVATDSHSRFLRFPKVAAPAAPNLSESQKAAACPA